MKIIIGGDLVPTKNNIDFFEKGNLDKIIGQKIQKKWFDADFRIFNLETPLIDKKSPILKSGPHLSSSTASIDGIIKLKPSLISMANNHIMDHGISGYNTTLEIFDDKNLDYLGVGENLKKASQYKILKKDNFRVGIYACAEHEFTIASKNRPGANPFDPLESLDHIKELSKNSDYVIVLYHGLKEHYRYPTPDVQKVCRKMVEKGANLVLCQHNHCIGSYEKFKESTILYGQGNFIFNKRNNEYWNTGLLVEVNIEINNNITDVNFIPFKSSDIGIDFLDDEKTMDAFYNRSEKIKDPQFIKTKYSDFANKKIDWFAPKKTK